MTTMQRITLAYVIPEWKFAKFDFVSRVEHDVFWICEQCGPIEPVTCMNGFMRRQCACERAQREKVASKQKKEISMRCYSWLGSEYLAPDLELKSFENFYPQHQENTREYHSHLAFVRLYAQQIVQGEQVENLEITGSYGTGKTHLATAICNHLRANQVSCLFCTVPDLFDELYSRTFTEQEDLLTQASSTTLLVLDDLDKLHVRQDTNGAFQKSKLFGILNRRYLKHVPTIITANEGDDFSKWLDEATMSRLGERLTPLKMSGMDYRSRGRQ